MLRNTDYLPGSLAHSQNLEGDPCRTKNGVPVNGTGSHLQHSAKALLNVRSELQLPSFCFWSKDTTTAKEVAERGTDYQVSYGYIARDK